jgi:hypothetical protein
MVRPNQPSSPAGGVMALLALADKHNDVIDFAQAKIVFTIGNG